MKIKFLDSSNFDMRKQNPLLVPAIIAGGAALVSSILGSKSQSSANETNIELQREQNAWNLEQWNREAAYNERMWNMTNEYNTPAAQRKRYEEAGLNPALMMSNIESGMATSQTSPTANSAPPAHVEPINYNFGQSMIDAMQVAQASAQVQKTKAESQLINEQSSYFGAKALAEIGELKSRGWLNWRQADKLKQEYDFFDEFRLDNARATILQNEYVYQRIQESHLQQTALQLQNDIQSVNLAYLPKEKQQALSLALARTVSDINMNNSQINLNSKNAEQVVASTARTWLDAYGVSLSNDQFKKLMPFVIKQMELEARQRGADYWNPFNYVGKALGGSVGVTRVVK